MRRCLMAAAGAMMVLLSGCGLIDTLVGSPVQPSINPSTYQVVQPADFVANPQSYIKKPIVLSGPIASSKQIDRNVWQVQAELAHDQMNAYVDKDLTTESKWLRVYFVLDSVESGTQVQGGYRNVWIGSQALFVGRPDRLDLLAADPSTTTAQ